jgi:2',3'-cyclic-nucleotide 2'-phosphodiesterase (5'-nucleotidase family)
MRSNETNVSDMVLDAIRADVGADVAIMNSGGIRGDRSYAAGPVTRRAIITMAPFGNVVCKIAAPGRVILDALNNGTSRLPFNDGRFPMISGMTMKVNVAAPAGSRISDVMIAGQPLDLQKIYTIAASDYQLKGGDGYAMFMGQRVLIAPEAGLLVASAIEKYVASRPQISPSVEGRIIIAR